MVRRQMLWFALKIILFWFLIVYHFVNFVCVSNIKGMVVTLSENCTVLLSYMGTQPPTQSRICVQLMSNSLYHSQACSPMERSLIMLLWTQSIDDFSRCLSYQGALLQIMVADYPASRQQQHARASRSPGYESDCPLRV